MSCGIDGSAFLSAIRPALEAGDPNDLAEALRCRWRPGQVSGLLAHPDVDVRRVATMSLGLVGDLGQVNALVRALRDRDEQVTQMAEYALWAIWFRSGSRQATPVFREGVAFLEVENYPAAIRCFEQATFLDPTFAEAYNQQAIAHFLEGDYRQTAQACCRTIRLMPVHFGAVAGLGHAYTQLGCLPRALHCYRKALQINPNLQELAHMIGRLSQCVQAEEPLFETALVDRMLA